MANEHRRRNAIELTSNQNVVLKQVNELAWTLDNAVRLPIINYRIGLDAVVGLVPGIGDVAGLLISAYILCQAMKLRVSKYVLTHMLFIAIFEAIIGLIPLFGDLFDTFFKSNMRHVALINAYIENPLKRRAASRNTVLIILAGVCISIGIISVAGIALLSWLWHMLGSLAI